MTGPFSECQVRLHRDSLTTPWGFRLQGGKDFKTPLTVQRVFVGSPADGELHRGDVIESVQNYDTSNMMHKQAQDLIKQAGGSLSLMVRRSLQGRARSAPPAPTPQTQSYRSRSSDFQAAKPAPSGGSMYGFVPKPQPQYGAGSGGHLGGVPQEFGHSYGVPQGARRAAPPNMLSKVNQSLSQALWQNNPEEYDPEYEPRSVGQLQQMFSTPSRSHHAHSATFPRHQSKPRWTKPETIPGTPKTLLEPGWTPKSLAGGHDYGSRPMRQQSLPSTPPAAHYQHQYQQPDYLPQSYVPQNNAEDYKPSWKGSLKSSGGPKPWEMRDAEALAPDSVQHRPRPQAAAEVPVHQPRVQNVHYGPGSSAPEYQQHSAGEHGPSDSAKVAHLQYNTPIGLYSKENVEKVLHSQTGGRPGEGTMQVTGPGSKPFNPAQSDVYRMVLEEDEMRKPHHHQPHHHQQQHPQQHQQPHQQPQSARYAEHAPGQEMHYQGYMDPSHQSPSMQALEARFDDSMGTSDF